MGLISFTHPHSSLVLPREYDCCEAGRRHQEGLKGGDLVWTPRGQKGDSHFSCLAHPSTSDGRIVKGGVGVARGIRLSTKDGQDVGSV